jgi:hypothetical protein
MGTAATFQKERRIELLRGLTNRLALNCHSGVHAIEETGRMNTKVTE